LLGDLLVCHAVGSDAVLEHGLQHLARHVRVALKLRLSVGGIMRIGF
jgi:hypothetical protein